MTLGFDPLNKNYIEKMTYDVYVCIIYYVLSDESEEEAKNGKNDFQ